jgi:hypothetical protein
MIPAIYPEVYLLLASLVLVVLAVVELKEELS